MSPIRTALLILAAFLILSACKSEAENEESTKEDNKTDPPVAEEEDKEDDENKEETGPDTEKIVNQAYQVMEDAENYTIETNMNQYIELEDEKHLDNTYRSNTIVNLDPVHYHEEATIHKAEVQDEQETNINNIQLERYFTDKGVYIFESNEGRWVKFPEEFTADFQTFDRSVEHPERLLELLNEMTEDTQVKEGEDHYRFIVSGDHAQTQEMALEMMRMVNSEFSSSMRHLLYIGAIKKLSFEIDVNKETFHPTKLKMDLAMTLNGSDGRPYESNHTVVARYSSVDSTEKVVIPEEVLEAAEEMELEEFSGFEEMEEFDTIDGTDLEEYYKELKEEERQEETDTSEKDK